MADRYFSPTEVEALIPALDELMGGVIAAHQEATAVRERLHAEQQRIMLSGGGVFDRKAWSAGQAELERCTERIRAGLDKVVALGGLPKDLDLGLVDFLHLRQGRQVNLCWKYGEREIRYWHGLDEGYAARKPL